MPSSENEYTYANSTSLDSELFNIREIQLTTVEPIKFKKPFYDATMGPFFQYTPCVLRILDNQGYWGECEFPLSTLWVLKNIFVPILLESSNKRYSELYQKLYWSIRNEGFRGSAAMALGHLDRVFYDLAAKRHGVPVYKYLGGKNSSVAAYASGAGVNIIGDELIEECLTWEAQGYRVIKMKIGGFDTTVKEDIQRIISVREALKPETQLAVDANQVMSLNRAIDLVNALEGANIAWLEEPLHSAALVEIESLCRMSSIPISYGESERSIQVFPSIIRAGVKHLQPIAGHINSIKDWLSIARMAKKYQLQFTGGGVSQINAQFIAVVGDSAMLEFLEPVVGYLSEVCRTKPEIRNGHFILPEKPGIGVELDWDRLHSEKKITNHQVWK